MASIERIRVQLDFPLQRVKEPVVYRLVTDFRLVPNIRRANIDVHTGGMMVLEIEGAREDLDAATDYLRGLGITVTDVGVDDPWAV